MSLEEGEYAEAKKVLQQALGLAPNDALALRLWETLQLSWGSMGKQKSTCALRWRESARRILPCMVAPLPMLLTFPVAGTERSGTQRGCDCFFEQANRAAPNRSEARQAIALRQGIGQGDSGLYMHQPPAAETPSLKRPLRTVLEGR